MTTSRPSRAVVFAALSLLAAACSVGAERSMSWGGDTAGGEAEAPASAHGVQLDVATRGARALYAEAAPQPAAAAPAPASPTEPPAADATATDAVPVTGPLLIYDAHLYLAVFKVQENLKVVADLAKQAGGFLSRQTDREIVIRVPAARFHTTLAAIEALGDVTHREVQATDVSEEFRDLDIRLRNALQVRDRLAELLTRAQKVEESLQIERELERLAGDIERLKGRMRFLQDRVAYSTITVSFQPKEQQQVGNTEMRLPFTWLEELGLQGLLRL